MKFFPDDLAAWRREQRRLLIARREAIDEETLACWRQAIDAHLESGFPGLAGATLGICWPHRQEYDARHLAARFRASGGRTALPVVVKPRAPLVFREWHPGVELVEGVLGIPYPVESPEVVPDAVLVPLVGFDSAGYRLGYGGGFFDRTLEAMRAMAKPLTIGVGFELCALESIFPQPHDQPMDWIVTERGIYRRHDGSIEFLEAPRELPPASPVCYAAELERPEQDAQRRNKR